LPKFSTGGMVGESIITKQIKPAGSKNSQIFNINVSGDVSRRSIRKVIK